MKTLMLYLKVFRHGMTTIRVRKEVEVVINESGMSELFDLASDGWYVDRVVPSGSTQVLKIVLMRQSLVFEALANRWSVAK